MQTYELVGHEIETPLVNAAGSINGTNPEHIVQAVGILSRTAIGAITVGSFTVPEQSGNEAKFGSPVYHRDRETGTTYNALGLPNIGLDGAKAVMPEILARAHHQGKPVIASVSPVQPTPEIGDTLNQIKRLIYEFQLAGVDLIEVNPSCPNIFAEDDSCKPILGYDLEGMQQLVTELAPWTGTIDSKVGIKLPPYISDEQKQMPPELAKLLKEKPVFGFIVTANSVPNQVATDAAGKPILSVPSGVGGMSGPATKETGRQQLRMWNDLIGDELDIISTLGVDSGQELAVRRRLGATAAGVLTFLWQRSNWGLAVTDLLQDWATAEEE
ncbi:MAG TPA: hypothetical protein VK674_04325 [Candidatus Limnocylindria bacterium]|nr:hypothetical protein [Candidatus Limnocylindria bacterium]